MTEKDNVVNMPQTVFERELDEDRKAYWLNVLRNCEKGADYARQMLKLGEYAVEKSEE